MFDGINLTLLSDMDQDNTWFSMKDPLRIDVSSPSTYTSRYEKGDKTKIRTQQYTQLNTGVNKIQQLTPDGPHYTHTASDPNPLIYR